MKKRGLFKKIGCIVLFLGIIVGVYMGYDSFQNSQFIKTVPKNVADIDDIENFRKKADYSNKNNWMFLPEENTKPVDTIYLYPSSYGIITEAKEDICGINDKFMRGVADYFASMQVGIFEESSNLYVPYYRQFSIDGLLNLMEHNPEAMTYLASQDIYNMLDYYFKNLNEGRPFILAGHSQGSLWMEVVLADYMERHPEYLERMVAAYIIGFSVTEDYLAKNPHLKFATGADDTGVIISYNTEEPGNGKNCVVIEGAISINPINWKLDDTYASKEENLGSLDLEGNSIEGAGDAQVDAERGVVICTTVENTPETKESVEEYFSEKSLHLQDYGLYYENLKKNVSDRIEAFIK